MPFWKCFYHVVWATKQRLPIIQPVYEAIIYQAVEMKCQSLDCALLGINSVEDHLHAALSIPRIIVQLT
jgi:putative transposase